ncbi:membrane protein [Oceanicola sp. 22II-s10i]|uniref:ceramidase domain-containing protein n=1 Tax=Oceanicola sp. 22II-s10i TaxID=1317116 RepID=UPI000B52758E|nr:ceramidase domain-containing protein [Oceanicola sp. 22II-s10i]OWU86616.1 membrane protein [Oceanicola sp. 22II-s10i]
MDWTRAVDAYCERLGPGYWAEPVNLLTNLAFMIAAVIMWRRVEGRTTGRALSAILFVIGVGSWLFHSHAQAWSGLADVVPIMVFIIAYIFVANRDYLDLVPWRAAVGAVLMFILIGLMGWRFGDYEWLGSSAAYAPVPLVIIAYGTILRRRMPYVSRGLWIGAVLLMVSLTFRTVDMQVCAAWPLGTHFMWHILNAVMLGWMIEVWRRWVELHR